MPGAVRIRGVLFDKDGTLFDFAATWGAVVRETLAVLAPDAAAAHQMAVAAGFDLGAGRFVAGSAIVAGATSEIAEIWARHRPDLGAAGVERVANRIAAEAAARPGRLVPAARDLAGLLGGLRADGYVLGIATHDSEAAAREHVAAVGALDAFAFVAGYDSGHGLKPAPGMLTAFAAATGLSVREVAMVGDSRHDLEMVRAAGAAVAIGVLTGPALVEDLAPYADHILPSIEALPALLARLADGG